MLWRDKGKKKNKTFIQYSVRCEECRVTEILTPLMWEGETVVQCSSKIQDPTTTGVRLVQYKIKKVVDDILTWVAAPRASRGGGMTESTTKICTSLTTRNLRVHG